MRPVLLLLAALFAWTGAARAADWTPNGDDSLLFELRSGTLRLGDGVRGYQRADDQCVVLGDVVLTLDLPIRVDRAADRASGWVFAEDETLVVDGRAGTVDRAGRRRALPPGAISYTPEGWCVGTAELGRWMGVTIASDLANASLRIEADRKLPFELAAERRTRAASLRPARSFDLATLPQAPTPYRAWRTPALDVVASAGVTRLADTPMRRDVRYEVFASGEVAGVSVDARLASDARGAPDRLRARAFRADPAGGLPLGATLIEAGDVSAVASPLVAGGAQGRGMAITNRPLTQPDTFSTTTLTGDLPAGWEAELYRNDELIAFAAPRSDGRYEFRGVPLRFGANALTVVLYGPQGQVRRQTQRVRVGEESIPPERTWYWVSANNAGRDLVALRDVPRGTSDGWRGSIGLEHGLSRRTSVFAYCAHPARRSRAAHGGRRRRAPELRRGAGAGHGRVAAGGRLGGAAAGAGRQRAHGAGVERVHLQRLRVRPGRPHVAPRGVGHRRHRRRARWRVRAASCRSALAGGQVGTSADRRGAARFGGHSPVLPDRRCRVEPRSPAGAGTGRTGHRRHRIEGGRDLPIQRRRRRFVRAS